MPVSTGPPPGFRVLTREEARREQREVLPVYQVNLPGWDDVVHVVPTSLLSDEDRRRRRGRIFFDLAHSPTPQVVQDFAKIAQEIDNVQDALVTLSVLGRVAVKVAGRALPLVGEIALAADALNAVNVLYPNTVAVAATGAVVRGARKLSGRSKYVVNAETKRQLQIALGQAPGTYQRRLAETLRTGKIGFGWGEALQVLQTSDWFLGFGLSLGPIFGALQDGFFGALRGARFDVTPPITSSFRNLQAAERAGAKLGPDLPSVSGFIADVLERKGPVIDFPGVVPIAEKVLGIPKGTIEGAAEFVTRPLVTPAAKAAGAVAYGVESVKRGTVAAATAVWRAGKWLTGVRGDLSWEDHVELLLAQLFALEELAPLMAQWPWEEHAARVAREPDPSPPAWVVHPRRGITRGEVSALLRDGPARQRLDWLDAVADPVARQFAFALVDTVSERLLQVLEAPHARVETRSSVLIRALRLMTDYDLAPPYQRHDAETLRYIQGLAQLVEAAAPARPPLAAVHALYLASFPGVSLSSPA